MRGGTYLSGAHRSFFETRHAVYFPSVLCHSRTATQRQSGLRDSALVLAYLSVHAVLTTGGFVRYRGAVEGEYPCRSPTGEAVSLPQPLRFHLEALPAVPAPSNSTLR